MPLVRVAGGYKFYATTLLAGALVACVAAPPAERTATAPAERTAAARAATEQPAGLAQLQEALEAREREANIAREQARMAELEKLDAQRRAAEMAAAKGVRGPEADLASELNRLGAQISDLKAQQTERGWVLTLRSDMLFETGGASLKEASQRAIDNLAAFMRKYPDRDIAIEGFTDAVGSQAANHRMSEIRAEALKRALVSRGIEASRMDARGYGPAFPVASNETPTGRQLNRRVEIVINPS